MVNAAGVEPWRRFAKLSFAAVSGCASALPYLNLHGATAVVAPLVFLSWVPYLAFASSRDVPATTLWSVAFVSLAFAWVHTFHPLGLLVTVILFGGLFLVIPVLAMTILTGRRRTGKQRTGIPPVFTDAAFPGAALMAGEVIRRYWPVSFPYGSPAAVIAAWRPVQPIVRATGEWGLTGTVFAVNILVLLAGRTVYRSLRGSSSPRDARPRPITWIATAPIAAAALLALAVTLHPLPTPPTGTDVPAHITDRTENTGTIAVTLAQTVFGSHNAWPDHIEMNTQIIRTITERAAGSDLVIFGEGTIDMFANLAVPAETPEVVPVLNAVSGAAENASVNVLLGALERTTLENTQYSFTSSFLFDRTGALEQIYRKQRLAPFGERNPFPRLWPGGGDYLTGTTAAHMLSPGRRSGIIHVPIAAGTDRTIKTLRVGVMICLESAYPDLARSLEEQGAQLLVNMSNDYWTRNTHGMLQFANQTRLRALETGLPVVRVSNGGYSFFADPRTGREVILPPFQIATATVVVEP